MSMGYAYLFKYIIIGDSGGFSVKLSCNSQLIKPVSLQELIALNKN